MLHASCTVSSSVLAIFVPAKRPVIVATGPPPFPADLAERPFARAHPSVLVLAREYMFWLGSSHLGLDNVLYMHFNLAGTSHGRALGLEASVASMRHSVRHYRATLVARAAGPSPCGGTLHPFSAHWPVLP